MEGEAPGIGALFSQVSSLRFIFFYFLFFSPPDITEERDVAGLFRSPSILLEFHIRWEELSQPFQTKKCEGNIGVFQIWCEVNPLKLEVTKGVLKISISHSC